MTRTGIARILLAGATALALCLPAPRAAAAGEGRLAQLLQSYETIPGEQVIALLSGLGEDEFLQLTAHAALSRHILLHACQANGTLWMQVQGTTVTCQSAWAEAQEAMQWISWEEITANARAERDRLVVGLDCASGRIDAASCQTYFETQSAISQGMHDTTMQILRNWSGECTVGVDPDCVPY